MDGIYLPKSITILMRKGSRSYFLDLFMNRISDENNPDVLVFNLILLAITGVSATAFLIMLWRGILTDVLVTQILLLTVGTLLGAFLGRRSHGNAN